MPTADAAEQRAVAYCNENYPAARVHNSAGASVTAVSVMPSADDDEFREMARSIGEKSPHWLVVWGTYTRQFVAFPLFDAPRGMILAAGYPDALTGRMREAERRFQRGTGAWTVWMDAEAAPLYKVQHRADAERILLDCTDHDYMYIESPAGEQYAWNHVRRCWERI